MNVSKLIQTNGNRGVLQYEIECSLFLQKKQTGYVDSFYKIIANAFVRMGQLANKNLHASELQLAKDMIRDKVVESVFRTCVGAPKVVVSACLDSSKLILQIKRVECLATLQKLQEGVFVDALELPKLEMDLFTSLSSLSFDEWNKLKSVCREDPFARKMLERFQEVENLRILQMQEASLAVQDFDLLCEACRSRPEEVSSVYLLIDGLKNETEKSTLLRCLFIEGTVYLYSKDAVKICKVAASLIKKEMSLAERIVLLPLIQEVFESKKGNAFLDEGNYTKELYDYVSLRLEKMQEDIEALRCFDFIGVVKSILQNKYLAKPTLRHRFFELTDEDSLFHTLSRLKNDNNESSYPKMITLLEGLKSYLNACTALSVCFLLRGISGEKARAELLSSVQVRAPGVLAKVCEVASSLITRQMALKDRQIILSLLDLMIRDKGGEIFPKGKNAVLCIYDYLADKLEKLQSDRIFLMEIKPCVDFLLESKELSVPLQKHRFFTLTNEKSLFHELMEFRYLYGPLVFDSLTSQDWRVNEKNISFMRFLMKGISNEDSRCALVGDIRKIDQRDISKVHKVSSSLITEDMTFKEKQVLYSVITWMIKEKSRDAFLENQDPLVSIYNHLDEKIRQISGKKKEIGYSLLGTVITLELLMQNKKLKGLSEQHPLMDKSGVLAALCLVKKTYYDDRRAVCNRLFSLFEDFEEELRPSVIAQVCSLIQGISDEESQLNILNDLIIME